MLDATTYQNRCLQNYICQTLRFFGKTITAQDVRVVFPQIPQSTIYRYLNYYKKLSAKNLRKAAAELEGYQCYTRDLLSAGKVSQKFLKALPASVQLQQMYGYDEIEHDCVITKTYIDPLEASTAIPVLKPVCLKDGRPDVLYYAGEICRVCLQKSNIYRSTAFYSLHPECYRKTTLRKALQYLQQAEIITFRNILQCYEVIDVSRARDLQTLSHKAAKEYITEGFTNNAPVTVTAPKTSSTDTDKTLLEALQMIKPSKYCQFTGDYTDEEIAVLQTVFGGYWTDYDGIYICQDKYHQQRDTPIQIGDYICYFAEIDSLAVFTAEEFSKKMGL